MYEVISIGFCLENVSLIVKIKNHVGTETQYVDIVFYQVLAYSFDCIERKNIIHEIADKSILLFLDWYYSDRKAAKQSMMTYGLPLAFTDKTLAIKALKGKYIYFEVNAYIGMDGFVVAKEMKMKQR